MISDGEHTRVPVYFAVVVNAGSKHISIFGSMNEQTQSITYFHEMISCLDSSRLERA